MSYETIKNYRQRLKERSVYVLGDECQCCGYKKAISALEFHHLNPAEKEFSFNENTNRSWSKTREELKKCILVCANCHREIHASLIDNSMLVSSFSEDRANEIDLLVEQTKNHTLYYCKNCGVEVWRGNEYCHACALEKKRKVERPTREELKKLIRTNSFAELGRKFGVSDNAIRKWCISENLPSKTSIIKQINDQEWELI